MAEITLLVDDLDGQTTEGVESVYFSYKGEDFVIDLGEKNQDRLDEVLAEFIDKARKPDIPAKAKARTNKAETEALRAWANDNGYELGDRGRISQEVKDAYAAAQAAPAPAAAQAAPAAEASAAAVPAKA